MLAKLLDEASALKRELDALRPLDPAREARVLQYLRRDWNYHSNAIEGNSLTYGETLSLLREGITASGKPLKDHYEIKGHNEVLLSLEDIVKHHTQLTEHLIREFHTRLLVEPYEVEALTPDGQPTRKRIKLGAYKTTANHVQLPSGEMHYYASPEETPARMMDLMAWYNEENTKATLHPILLAAEFHYQFVAIHPFDDGNGRMARIMMNLLLMRAGYPPAVIRTQDKLQYFKALAYADQSGNTETFSELIAICSIRSLETMLKAARGEEYREGNELDKELALFDASLARDVVINEKRDIKLILDLFEGKIGELLDCVQVEINKMKKYFVYYGYEVISSIRNSKDQVENKENKIPGEASTTSKACISLLSEANDCTHLKVTWGLNGYNRSKENPFGLQRSIDIAFEPFRYKISYNGQDEDNVLKEIIFSYSENIDERNIKGIAEELGLGILKEIRRITQN